MKKESLPVLSSETTGHQPTSFFQLEGIIFENRPHQVLVKIQAEGGLSQVRDEKMIHPGRLVLELPSMNPPSHLDSSLLTDHLLIPRIRFAQHEGTLRLMIDTVLKILPSYHLEKSEKQITLTFEKTPEMMAEAKTRTTLFSLMQRGDRESVLKMGGQDDGGILFANNNPPQQEMAPARPTSSQVSAQGIRVEKSKGTSDRVVFILDDRHAHKIFVEDTGTPLHIQKIRPAHEIRGVQARLKYLGYVLGDEDGSLGPQTREALRLFQKEKGLVITGAPDRKTQAALKNDFGY